MLCWVVEVVDSCVISAFGLVLYISSLTLGILRSRWIVSLVTYQGLYKHENQSVERCDLHLDRTKWIIRNSIK